MKKTKTIPSLLVTVMLAGIGSACSSSGTTPPAVSAPKSSEATAKEQNKYAQHMKISYASGNNNLDVNNDVFAKIWKDKFNFDWEILPVPSNNNNEMFRIMINSGDMPDIGSWNYNHSEYVSYVKQGLLKKLPDGWRKKWPNLAAAQDMTGINKYVADQVGSENILFKPVMGKNYPVDTLINHSGIWYRADWFRAVGAEIKEYYTTVELMDIARKIKQQDPGKAGKALIPITIPTSELPIIFIHPNATHYQEVSQFYQDANGVFQWGLAEPEILEGLKLWRQAYDEGLLHPEFYNLPYGAETEAKTYTAGISAMNAAAGMGSVGTRQASFMKSNLGVDPNESLNFSFFTDKNGTYRANEIPNFAGSLIFNPKLDDAKFERILDILNESASEEGQLLINLGIEGTDWEKKPDGTIVNLNGDLQISDKYKSVPNLWPPLLVLRDNFTLVNPSLPKIWRDKARNQYVKKTELTDPKNPKIFAKLDPDVYFYSSPARTRAVMNISTELAGIVLKGPNVEANWNAWVKAKMPLIQPVLDELTAMKKKK
ncbi:putative aldouronate transport system substrate-binding protein [Paenibacillus sp. 1_12]|uniref:hypothetical protein n=1 Tax=Paenibacillus sp. 1_12 TaxID=1566278 RepID=UPI0008E0C025|nr:hypothetical protein [Paenibacillus sp. 1_12]SFM47301.1 putative aldouronate transport system substrate-binding protein [Paenibacillus sp. 1_12]